MSDDAPRKHEGTTPTEQESTTTESEMSTALKIAPSAQADETADRIVRSHVLWAMGAGLIPIPLADIAGVTAIQMDALKQLSSVYGVDYTEAKGKSFVTALAGGAAARIGASAVKLIPGIGTLLGGVSMSALSGASTYAVCHVAINHFKIHGNFLDLDLEDAKAGYQAAMEKGKSIVQSLAPKASEARKIHEQIDSLELLKNDGVLSDLEFQAKKAALLEKLEALEKGDNDAAK